MFLLYQPILDISVYLDAHYVDFAVTIKYAGREKGCSWPARTGRLWAS